MCWSLYRIRIGIPLWRIKRKTQEMITEDYVSFETAKLLKEKGFDVYVSSFYDDEEKRDGGMDT